MIAVSLAAVEPLLGFRVPAAPTPLHHCDPSQAASPSLIGARNRRALSLCDRLAVSIGLDTHRRSDHELSQDDAATFCLSSRNPGKRQNPAERTAGSKPPGFAQQGMLLPRRRGWRAPHARWRSDANWSGAIWLRRTYAPTIFAASARSTDAGDCSPGISKSSPFSGPQYTPHAVRPRR